MSMIQQQSCAQNVGDNERLMTGLASLALIGGAMTSCSYLGRAMAATGGILLHRAVTGYCPVYAALEQRASEAALSTEYPDHSKNTVVKKAPRIEHSIRIHASPQELYAFWRQFDNLPRFMSHLRSVECLTSERSRWTADGPLGMPVTWEAEVYNEIPNRLIAWRSLPESSIRTAGSVRFLPIADGEFTEVKVNLQYSPPGGKVGARISEVLGADPHEQIAHDLNRLKDMLEAEFERSSLDRM